MSDSATIGQNRGYLSSASIKVIVYLKHKSLESIGYHRNTNILMVIRIDEHQEVSVELPIRILHINELIVKRTSITIIDGLEVHYPVTACGLVLAVIDILVDIVLKFRSRQSGNVSALCRELSERLSIIQGVLHEILLDERRTSRNFQHSQSVVFLLLDIPQVVHSLNENPVPVKTEMFIEGIMTHSYSVIDGQGLLYTEPVYVECEILLNGFLQGNDIIIVQHGNGVNKRYVSSMVNKIIHGFSSPSYALSNRTFPNHEECSQFSRTP